MRQDANLTQAQLGAIVNVLWGAVSAWENGRIKCPPEKLKLLKIELGYS